MTPQPAYPLQEHVGRGEVSDQQVGIDVYALLGDLRGNQNTAVGPVLGILAQPLHPVGFQLLPAEERETGMQEPNLRSALATRGFQAAVGFLGIVDGVANPEYALALAGPCQNVSSTSAPGLGKTHDDSLRGRRFARDLHAWAAARRK